MDDHVHKKFDGLHFTNHAIFFFFVQLIDKYEFLNTACLINCIRDNGFLFFKRFKILFALPNIFLIIATASIFQMVDISLILNKTDEIKTTFTIFNFD